MVGLGKKFVGFTGFFAQQKSIPSIMAMVILYLIVLYRCFAIRYEVGRAGSYQ